MFRPASFTEKSAYLVLLALGRVNQLKAERFPKTFNRAS